MLCLVSLLKLILLLLLLLSFFSLLSLLSFIARALYCGTQFDVFINLQSAKYNGEQSKQGEAVWEMLYNSIVYYGHTPNSWECFVLRCNVIYFSCNLHFCLVFSPSARHAIECTSARYILEN